MFMLEYKNSIFWHDLLLTYLNAVSEKMYINLTLQIYFQKEEEKKLKNKIVKKYMIESVN